MHICTTRGRWINPCILRYGFYWANFSQYHCTWCPLAGALCHQELTHWGWVTHICVGNLTIISSDNALSPGQTQCWNIVDWTLRPLAANFNEKNEYIFIDEESFENVVCKMTVNLSRPQSVKILTISGGACLPHWKNKKQNKKKNSC